MPIDPVENFAPAEFAPPVDQSLERGVPFLDLLMQMGRQEHAIGSVVESQAEIEPIGSGFRDPGFNPLSHVPERHSFYSHAYVDANNLAQVAEVTRRIDMEMEVDRTIQAAGFGKTLAAGLTLGLVDPVNFLPFGAAYKAFKTGSSITRAAAVTAGVAGTSAALQEAVLQATQLTRTPEESAYAVAGATLLGGMLGGAAGKIGRIAQEHYNTKLAMLLDDTAADLDAEVFRFGPPAQAALKAEKERVAAMLREDSLDGLTSAGARETGGTLLEEGVKLTPGVKALLNMGFSKLDPLMRTMTSGAVETRRAAQLLGETPLTMERNLRGLASQENVYRAVANWKVQHASAMRRLDDLYSMYVQGHKAKFGDLTKIALQQKIRMGEPATKMTYTEFRIEVAKAMRRGDKSSPRIKEVDEAAKMIREEVYEPLFKEAVKNKLIPEEVAEEGPVTALSYMNRAYDIEKIGDPAQRQEFKRVISEWLSGKRDESLRRLDEYKDARSDQQALIKDLAKTVAAIQRGTVKGAEKPTVQEIMAAVRKVLDDMVDDPGAPGTVGSVSTEKARLAARKAFYSKLEKEISQSVEDEIHLELGSLMEDAARQVKSLSDEIGFDDLESVIKAEMTDPGTALAKDVAERTAKSSVNDALNEAMIAAEKAFQRSLKAQKDAIERAIRKGDVTKLGDLIKTVKQDVMKKSAKAARQAAREATKELREQLSKAKKALKEFDKQHGRDLFYADLDQAELVAIAEDIIANIEGTPGGRLGYTGMVASRPKGSSAGKAAPLRHRAFLIDDELIEPWLINDVEMLSRMYVRSVAPDVEITRIMQDDLELTGTRRRIKDEWERIAARPDAPKNWRKLRDNDLRDVVAMGEIVRGTFNMPPDPKSWFHRGARMFRQLNYIRMLGGMTISAVPDMARPMMVYGINNFMGDLVLPFMRGAKGLRLSKQDAADLGAVMELVNNSRMANLADVMDEYGRYTKFERGLGAAADSFGVVSLMGWWNAGLKKAVGAMVIQHMHKALKAEAAGKISAKDAAWLRSMYIDEGTGAQILKQFEKHGGVEDGIAYANWKEWDHGDAKRLFQSAIGREMDRTIVTPGLDIPLTAMGGSGNAIGELGRMVLQFKRFSFAANQRMLMAGLQGEPLQFWSGLMMSVALGMMTAKLKSIGSGWDTDEWTAEKWIVEGLDRSGATGVFFEANNIMEKFTLNTIGLNPAMSLITGNDLPPMSRYASRNVAGSLLGPTFGTINTMVGTAQAGIRTARGEQEWTPEDTRKAVKLLPYSNLFYLRWLMSLGEDK